MKIVGNQPMPGPDKDGFKIMRIFPKGKGVYSLKRWNKVGNWTLQKRRGRVSGPFSWLPVSDEQAKQLISGEKCLVDEDIIQAK